MGIASLQYIYQDKAILKIHIDQGLIRRNRQADRLSAGSNILKFLIVADAADIQERLVKGSLYAALELKSQKPTVLQQHVAVTAKGTVLINTCPGSFQPLSHKLSAHPVRGLPLIDYIHCRVKLQLIFSGNFLQPAIHLPVIDAVLAFQNLSFHEPFDVVAVPKRQPLRQRQCLEAVLIARQTDAFSAVYPPPGFLRVWQQKVPESEPICGKRSHRQRQNQNQADTRHRHAPIASAASMPPRRPLLLRDIQIFIVHILKCPV